MLHGALEVVIGYLFVGVVLGALAGWLADRRGRNFWVYLVFTVVFPGTALISIPYLLIFTRRVKREPTPPESTGDDRLELLERLAKMRDSGALSEDEFQAEKARLLAGVVPQSAAEPRVE